ncbi:WD repeat-containing protein 70 [Smittium mucronatum]|uniref:WD repeat-containing protein 70 n=1 Tax=Smittium mucronatum TaxID=133383 RepID=A0A1R0GLQ4_9FUNG|nr:WD repeat-containing protein 70 [Smittium mucronatum]
MGLNNKFSKGFSSKGALDFAGMYKSSMKSGSSTSKSSHIPSNESYSNVQDFRNSKNIKETSIPTSKLENINQSIFDSQLVTSGLIPTEKSAILSGHTKMVTAIDWDSSGSRMISGGYDYLVKLWNFGAMDSSLRSFRELEPTEGNQINDLKFSTNGEMFLTATGSPQAKLFDRDGVLIEEYKKGDMYIRDMRHTSGHVSSLTSVFWNPKVKTEFITSANDSTVRFVWVPVSYLFVFVLAQSDGCISIWSSDGKFSRPILHLENAHLNKLGASALEMDSSGHKLLSRGMDNTVKLWDIRNFKEPTFSVSDMYSEHQQTNACFSPDEKIILATKDPSPIHLNKDNDLNPKLIFIDVNSSDILYQVEVSSGQQSQSQHVEKNHHNAIAQISDRLNLVKVRWHKSLNQIAVSKSNGQVEIYYDSAKSIKGVKMCMEKISKVQHVSSGMYAGDLAGRIITPHSLPLFKDTTSGSNKRRLEKIRKDPVASRKPDEDPREALLRHAAAAEESPYWVAPAYKKHQPKAIFDESGMKDEPEIKRRK